MVHPDECLTGQSSIREIVHLNNCLSGQLSVQTIVRPDDCPSGQLSVRRRNNHLNNCTNDLSLIFISDQIVIKSDREFGYSGP